MDGRMAQDGEQKIQMEDISKVKHGGLGNNTDMADDKEGENKR